MTVVPTAAARLTENHAASTRPMLCRWVSTAAGGVAFAEFFSEIAPEGVSSNVILGGGPLALDPNSSVWKDFSFMAVTGGNVSGGITLQLTAITGGDMGTSADIFYDDICISTSSMACPEPP